MQSILSAAQAAGLGLVDFSLQLLPALFSAPPGAFHHKLASQLEWALAGNRRILGALPREHGKTTFGLVAVCVREAARCWVEWQGDTPDGPRRRGKRHILLVGANQQEARARLRLVRDELESNPQLNTLFPGIGDPAQGPGKRNVAYRANEIVLASGLRIIAYGAGNNLRGTLFRGCRPDLVILDDPETDSGAASQLRRQAMRAWCERVLVPALDNQRGGIVWLGTFVHHKAVLAEWIVDHAGEGAEPKAEDAEPAAAGLTDVRQRAAAPDSTAANNPDSPPAPTPPALSLVPCAFSPSSSTSCLRPSALDLGPSDLGLRPSPDLSLVPSALDSPPSSNWLVFVLPAIDDTTGAPLWPERWSREALEQRRLEIGEAAFAQEYQLRPASAEGQRFGRGDFKSYDPAQLAEVRGEWLLDGEPLTVVAAMDPASGLSGRHDYSAVAVLGLLPEAGSDSLAELDPPKGAGRWAHAAQPAAGNRAARRRQPRFRAYVLEVSRMRGRFDDQLELLDRLAARWHPRVVGIESNAYQGVLRQAASDHGLPAIELHAGVKKEWRFENLSCAAARGSVFLPSSSGWGADFYAEALGWPDSAHDDQLDALAHALSCGGELLERQRRRGALEVLTALRPGQEEEEDDGDDWGRRDKLAAA